MSKRTQSTEFICTLPKDEQDRIHNALVDVGIDGDDLERAMNSRVCDLEDTIKEEI